VLGRYAIVREWADKPERAELGERLARIGDKERAEVEAAHRRHKQTVVLLHELAATLGAISEADPAWIQHPLYSDKQTGFSERNRELLQIAIDARLSGGSDQEVAHDLLEAIEKEEWGGWIPTDHDQVVATLRNVVDSSKAGKTAADVPTAAYEEFDRIREMRKRGDVAGAMRELDNLLIAYPGNATMYELKCELMLDKPGVKDAATRAACARTTELAPGDPTVHFAVGEALIKAGDVAGARAQLAQAAGKITNLKAGADDAWRRLIAAYQGLGALTWTEQAIEAAGLQKDPIAAQIASTRARFGVKKGMKGVKPEDEAKLVAAVKGGLELVYASKFGEAERAIDTAEKKWPSAPGLEAARCDLEMRQGRIDAAKAACGRALAGDANESWALYLAGLLDLRGEGAAAAKSGIAKLKHAIEVDPDLGQAWRALAKAYERDTGATDALDKLAQDYQAKFGQALPR
jgi:predicted Zn-dependent protease